MNRPLGRASLGLEWASDEENRSCRMGGKSEMPSPSNDTSLPTRLSPEKSQSTGYFLGNNYSGRNASESDNNNNEGTDNEDTQINRPRVIAGLQGTSKTELSAEVLSENERNVDLFGFGTGPGTNVGVDLPFSGEVKSDGNVEPLSNCEKDLDSQVVEGNMRRGDGLDINCISGQVREGGEGNLSNTARDNPQRDCSDGDSVSETLVSGSNIKRDSHITRLTKTEDITKIKGWRRKQFAVETSSIDRSDAYDVVVREVRMGKADDNNDNVGPSLREACGEEHSLCAFVCPDLDNYLDDDGKLQTDEENTSLITKGGQRSYDEYLPSTSTGSEIRKPSRWTGLDVPQVTKSSCSTRNTLKSNRKFQNPLRRSLRNKNTEATNENATSGTHIKNSDVQKERKVTKGRRNQLSEKKVAHYQDDLLAGEIRKKSVTSEAFVKKEPISHQRMHIPLSRSLKYRTEDGFPNGGTPCCEARVSTSRSSADPNGKNEFRSKCRTRVRIKQRRECRTSSRYPSLTEKKSGNESSCKRPCKWMEEDDEEVVINASDYATLNCDPNFIIEEISTVSFERATRNGFCFEETAQVFRLVGKLLPEVALLREIRHLGKNEPNLRWWIMNIVQDFTCIKVKINKKIGTVRRRAIIKTRKTNSPCFISFKGSDISRPMGIFVNPRLWPYLLIGPYYLNDHHEMSLKVDGKFLRTEYCPLLDGARPAFRLKRFISSLIIHSWRNKRDVVGMWLHERIGMKSYNFIEVLTKPRKIEFFEPCTEMDVMLPSVSEVTNGKHLDVHSSGKNVTGEESAERSEKIYLVPDVPDLGYVKARLHPDQTITVERPLYIDEKISRNRISDFLNEAIKQHLTYVPDELDVKWTIVKKFSKINKHKCLKILDIKRMRIVSKHGVIDTMSLPSDVCETYGLGDELFFQLEVLYELEELYGYERDLMTVKSELMKERESLIGKYLRCLERCDLDSNAKRDIKANLERIGICAQLERQKFSRIPESRTSRYINSLENYFLGILPELSGTCEMSPHLHTWYENAVSNYALPYEKWEEHKQLPVLNPNPSTSREGAGECKLFDPKRSDRLPEQNENDEFRSVEYSDLDPRFLPSTSRNAEAEGTMNHCQNGRHLNGSTPPPHMDIFYSDLNSPNYSSSFHSHQLSRDVSNGLTNDGETIIKEDQDFNIKKRTATETNEENMDCRKKVKLI